ncbi:transcriptional repressor TraM [Mesorhizobium sp.]
MRRTAYVTATIEMHTQQTFIATLLDVLGHVRLVPAD